MLNDLSKKTKSLLLAMTLSFAGTAQAVLISPTNIVANDFTVVPGYPAFGLANLTNQSGLITGFTNGVTTLSDYLAQNTNALSPSTTSGGGYFASSTSSSTWPASIVFDLGQSYLVDHFLLWNDTDGQGIANFELSFSDDPLFGSTVATQAFTATVGDINGTRDYLQPIPLQVFDTLGGQGRYLKLTVLSLAQNTSNPYYNRMNIGEIALDVRSASVPEPGVPALIGLVALLIVLRTRQRRATVAC